MMQCDIFIGAIDTIWISVANPKKKNDFHIYSIRAVKTKFFPFAEMSYHFLGMHCDRPHDLFSSHVNSVSSSHFRLSNERREWKEERMHIKIDLE